MKTDITLMQNTIKGLKNLIPLVSGLFHHKGNLDVLIQLDSKFPLNAYGCNYTGRSQHRLLNIHAAKSAG